MYDAALVLDEGERTIRNQQRKRDLIQAVRLQRTALERLDPGLRHLLPKLGIADPLNFQPQSFDGLPHGQDLPYKTHQIIGVHADASRGWSSRAGRGRAMKSRDDDGDAASRVSTEETTLFVRSCRRGSPRSVLLDRQQLNAAPRTPATPQP